MERWNIKRKLPKCTKGHEEKKMGCGWVKWVEETVVIRSGGWMNGCLVAAETLIKKKIIYMIVNRYG